MSTTNRTDPVRDALLAVWEMLDHQRWDHEGDEDSGQCDEGCDACKWEALREQARLALETGLVHAPKPGGCPVCGNGCYDPKHEACADGRCVMYKPTICEHGKRLEVCYPCCLRAADILSAPERQGVTP